MKLTYNSGEIFDTEKSELISYTSERRYDKGTPMGGHEFEIGLYKTETGTYFLAGDDTWLERFIVCALHCDYTGENLKPYTVHGEERDWYFFKLSKNEAEKIDDDCYMLYDFMLDFKAWWIKEFAK